MRICMLIGMRYSMGYNMGHSMPHGMRNGVRKGILNSMRCAPPAAAHKTSDESPLWLAQSWHAPRHAPWYVTYYGIHVRAFPGYA